MQTNLQRQKADQWLLGKEGRWEGLQKEKVILLRVIDVHHTDFGNGFKVYEYVKTLYT